MLLARPSTKQPALLNHHDRYKESLLKFQYKYLYASCSREKRKMYLCVRQMTVIMEKTTPMARPRSTFSTTTESQVTTQTIYRQT